MPISKKEFGEAKQVGFSNKEIDILFTSGLVKEILYSDLITEEMVKKAKGKAEELSKDLTTNDKRAIIAHVFRERATHGRNDKIAIRDVIKEYAIYKKIQEKSSE